MRVAFAAAAKRDFGAIVDYIALENPAAAEAVFRAIVAVTRKLADFPDMGRKGRLPDTRELPVAGLPYLIVYPEVPSPGKRIFLVPQRVGAKSRFQVLSTLGFAG